MSYTINHTQDGVVQYPMHTHKKYEIMLYLDGEGYMRTELGNIPFETGTIVIVPPNIKHGSISENGFRNISIEGDFEAYFGFDTVKSFEDNETERPFSPASTSPLTLSNILLYTVLISDQPFIITYPSYFTL